MNLPNTVTEVIWSGLVVAGPVIVTLFGLYIKCIQNHISTIKDHNREIQDIIMRMSHMRNPE